MSKLYIVNATRMTHIIPLRLDMPDDNNKAAYHRKAAFNIPPGSQIEMGDMYTEAEKLAMIVHLERFGGLDISTTHQTPPGFAGLAYRWERPATESDITRAHEVDMTRREKMSAREMVNSAKSFDGRLRQSLKRYGVDAAAMITETTIEEVAPPNERPPSGGLKSKIIGDVTGGKYDVPA